MFILFLKPARFGPTGLLVELEPESGQVSRSAKVSPASLRKQVTVAEGEKAAAAVVSNVSGMTTNIDVQ